MAALTRIDKLLSQLNDSLEDEKNSNVNNTNDEDENQVSMIDHIVYFVPDLESAMIKFEKLLGIKPKIGGRHLKWGSWNALFSLNNGTYFELLADDPNSDVKHEGFLKHLTKNISNDGEGIITFMYRPPQKYSKQLIKFKSLIKDNTDYDAGDIFGGERELRDNLN